MFARVMTRLVSWGLRGLGTVLNRAGHLIRGSRRRPDRPGERTPTGR